MTTPAPESVLQIDLTKYRGYLTTIIPLICVIASHFVHSGNISTIEARLQTLESGSFSVNDLASDYEAVKKAFTAKKPTQKGPSAPKHIKPPAGANGPSK